MDHPPDPNEKPKRRPRYSGKNPRKFHEKYKELNPGRYGQHLEKVLERGATPVGTHRPICVEEILRILNPQAGETGVDATLGFGGHSSHILPKLLPGGRLVALDQDPIERPKAEARLRQSGVPESALLIGGINFSEMKSFLQVSQISKVDFILADLGISSMQMDDPTRGFSFKVESSLDLRMNPLVGISAADLLAQIGVNELEAILIENSDEPRARVIAKALVAKRPRSTLQTTQVLREVMAGFSKQTQNEQGDTPIRRVFQALRIAVNNEFGSLDQFLNDIPEVLNPGGRVAILSFHSGEDRRVKKSFQAFERARVYRKVSPEFLRPSPEEQRSNSRSKSAKLRWAVT